MSPTYDPDDPSGRGSGWTGSETDVQRADVAKELRVPSLLLTPAQGPWQSRWRPEEGSVRKMRHHVQHEDGRTLLVLTPAKGILARLLAAQANGWEIARRFPPGRPEAWRTQNAPVAAPTRREVWEALVVAQGALFNNDAARARIDDVLARWT